MKKQILFFVIVNFLMISVAEAAIEININWESAISEDVAGYEIRVGNTLDNMSVVYTGAVSCSAGVCARTVTETQFPFEVGETYYFSVSSFTNDGTIAPASYSMAYLVISEYAIEEISVSQLFEELTQGTYTMVVGSSGDFTVTPVDLEPDPEPDPEPNTITIDLTAQTWGNEPIAVTDSTSYDGHSFRPNDPNHSGNCYFLADVLTVDSTNHWVNVPLYFPEPSLDIVLQFNKNDDPAEWLMHGASSGTEFVNPGYGWVVTNSTANLPVNQWVVLSVNLYDFGFQNGDMVTGVAFSSKEGVIFDDITFTDVAQ